MGFTWVIGFFLTSFSHESSEFQIVNKILVYIFILCNASNGVFIFFVFIFKKEVKALYVKMLHDKLPFLFAERQEKVVVGNCKRNTSASIDTPKIKISTVMNSVQMSVPQTPISVDGSQFSFLNGSYSSSDDFHEKASKYLHPSRLNEIDERSLSMDTQSITLRSKSRASESHSDNTRYSVSSNTGLTDDVFNASSEFVDKKDAS
jgi:hypothetical protein